jgi:hypothetical protein
LKTQKRIKGAFCHRQKAWPSALFQQCNGECYSQDQWILLKMRAKNGVAVTICPFKPEWADRNCDAPFFKTDSSIDKKFITSNMFSPSNLTYSIMDILSPTEQPG